MLLTFALEKVVKKQRGVKGRVKYIYEVGPIMFLINSAIEGEGFGNDSSIEWQA